MDSVAELRAWISAQFWKAEQIAGWVNSQFFRRAIHQQTRTGTASGNLPIITGSDGYVDDSFISATVIPDQIHAATSKTTPVDDDELPLADSADSYALKKLTWANLKATFIDTALTWTAAQIFPSLTTVGTGSGTVAAIVDGGSSSSKQMVFRTAGSNRWIWQSNNTAESGSNVGSDFQLLSRTDAGAALRTDLTVTRSNGNWAFGGSLQSPTIVTPTIASFTNAQHNHTNAAGGGQLTIAAHSDITESTWTPTITGTGSNPTVSYTTQLGVYVKISTAVLVSCQITISSISGGSGDVRISLPLTASSQTHALAAYHSGVDLSGTPVGFVALTVASSATTSLQSIQDNAANSPTTVAGLAAGDTIRFSGVYFT